jgi:hypothetical protein
MPFMKQKDPTLPPGQVQTLKFPVLHIGDVPNIDPKTYRLAFTGAIENPFEITYDELRAMPSVEFRGDIHCVTRWSKKATYWRGTLFRTLVERACPLPAATYVIQYADNDYTTNRFTADRSACSCRSAIFGRARSGSTASISPSTTCWDSGSATATTTMPIPGSKNATANCRRGTLAQA